MSKLILHKELVSIQIDANSAKFFHIELLSVGYNQMQVISTSGNFNNKGREHVVRFEGKDSFQQARALFYQKFLEKKAEGFVEREDLLKWQEAFHETYFEEHLEVLSEHRKAMKKKKYTSKKVASAKKPPALEKAKAVCSLCQKQMPQKMYEKINEWARGDGNWDHATDFIGYEKVLCIPCQVTPDIFKKKVEKNA